MKTYRLIGAGLFAIILCCTFSSCSDDDDDDNKTFPYSEYAVNLGLPSGTLWADRNIGADSPEDYGAYFAWGETKAKSRYDRSTYKWYDSSEDLTKYCTDSDYGFTDGKKALEVSDDAATAYWGDRWCMPTSRQIKELLDNCSWIWTTRNGISGYKVMGPNSNSIFLPAAGVRDYGNLWRAGSDLYYWSNSLYEDEQDNAYSLYFQREVNWLGLSWNYRHQGLPVRAVVR